MSIYEYQMRMKAFNLGRIDKEYVMHQQAWLNHQVTLTKEQGKKQVPIYKRFEDFFDYKKRIKEVEHDEKREITPQIRKMAQIAAVVNGGRR
ncbi:hypothetical protein [Ornithinibacillus massiliensis]|uniref:hypothetical protein n=1 Tax=Ornithinibacillus massiliensis TaxID=1944633 RepID=UPI001FECE11B|nr:hypothetical protein [Ornithinibacillus massiliensis]